MKNLPQHSSRHGISIVLAGFVFLAAIYSLVTPLFEASDELWHYPMVKYLADHRLSLPVQDPATAEQTAYRQEGGQPPLYYMIGALATFWIDTSDLDQVRRRNPHADIGVIVPDRNVNMVVHNAAREAFPWRGTALAMHIVRFLSVLMGAGTVYLTYRLGHDLLPDHPPIALAAAAFTAFNPMFLFISGVINNDNLSTLLATLLLWLIVRLIRHEDRPALRDYVILGLAAGAGMLAKFQIGFLLPLVALALGIAALRQRAWRPLIVGGAVSGGLTILIAGWWYARNYRLYGDATGINVFLDIVGRRAVPADLRQLWTERETFMMAFWGFFGGVNVPLPGWVYTVFNGIAAFALLGLFWLGIRKGFSPQRAQRMQRIKNKNPFSAFIGALRAHCGEPLFWARMIVALWPIIVLLSLISWTRQTWASQGRLWFSAIAPLSLGLAVGLAAWPRRTVLAFLSAAVSYFAVVAVLTPFAVIAPAYDVDRATAWDEPTHDTGTRHVACFHEPGDARESLCMAYREIEAEVQPGAVVKFAPQFVAKSQPSRDWSIFVHLTGDIGIIEAQRDVYPGTGLIATSDLEAGAAWDNPIAVKIPEGTYAPQTLTVLLGLYHLPTYERMRVSGDQADRENNWIVLGQVRLVPTPGSVPNPVAVNFGDQLELRGYAIGDRALAPGDSTTITLYWRARADIETDYRISVQVLKQGTTAQVGQVDWQPAPPTTDWRKGQEFITAQTLPIFPDAAPGQYHVMVRVYPADDPANPLRLITDAGGQSENSAWLSKIKIE